MEEYCKAVLFRLDKAIKRIKLYHFQKFIRYKQIQTLIMKNKTNRLFVLTFLIMVTMTSYLFAQSGQPKAADPTLEIARQKIDSLDKKLIEILGARERVVREIGIYKAKNNIPSLQAARFQQVIDKGIAAGKKENLSPQFITELLNAIHKESLRIEDALKESK